MKLSPNVKQGLFVAAALIWLLAGLWNLIRGKWFKALFHLGCSALMVNVGVDVDAVKELIADYVSEAEDEA